MAKIMKALKKLANLRSKPAQAAKKPAASKKKSQPVAAKKAEKPKKAAAPAKAAKPAKAVAAKGKAAAPAKAAKADKKAKEQPKKAAAPAATSKTAGKVAVETKPAKAGKAAAEGAPKKDKAQEKAAKTAPPEATEPVKGKGRKKAEVEATPVEPEEEIVLLDAEGRRYCRVKDCDQSAMVEGYCRYHYLLFWKNIQVRKKILTEGKLERYIEELTARYPDKYLEMLKKDLRSEKEFLAAIQELEIDEAAVDGDFEDEAQNYLDEVRGMGSEPANDREEDF